MGNSSESGAAAAQAAGALRTELIRDAAGRLIEKRTASHHCHYRYDALDRLLEARKFALESIEPLSKPEQEAGETRRRKADWTLKPLHTTRFAYDLLGNLVQEVAVDEVTGQSHTLHHSHDALGNRTQTVLPALPGQQHTERALNYLHYGSGHLHQINLSRRDTAAPEGSDQALAVHQLISDIERDALHREDASA